MRRRPRVSAFLLARGRPRGLLPAAALGGWDRAVRFASLDLIARLAADALVLQGEKVQHLAAWLTGSFGAVVRGH